MTVQFGDSRLPVRLWEKIVVISDGGCWWFTGAEAHGYGIFRWNGRSRLAHRVTYEELVGSPGVGLDLDHLCRFRPCCNPEHLEPVTRQENLRRGDSGKAWREIQLARTHCKWGHEFSGANLSYKPDGTRRCRACSRRLARECAARKKTAHV